MFANHQYRRNKGMGLVEIMVGLVIGLLGALVIFQVFEQTEARKRTTTATNDAQENGFSSVTSLERDIRQAGNGIVTIPGNTSVSVPNPAMGCTLQAFNTSTGLVTSRLAPLLIINSGPNSVAGSDEIMITYSTSSRMISPAFFTMSGNNILLTNAADMVGFAANDVMLAAQPGQNCAFAQVSSLSGTNTLVLTSGVAWPYNNPGGLPVLATYTSGATLVNFGTPVRNQYFVSGNDNLSVSDLNQGAVAAAANTLTIADQIVSLQAQYGIDTLNAGTVTWVEPTGVTWGYSVVAGTPTAANINFIKAIRYAVVSRSARMEGKQTGAACNTTTANPSTTLNPFPTTWPGAPAIDLSANPDWQCYRYKVFKTTTPLRNMLWREP